jgi:aerobic carbon-monoxide dehydrogenase large subunit
MTEKFFGKAMKRVEDPRFITGAGNYTDDIAVLNMVHAAMVRSPYAHAKIKSIDSSAALALPGVIAVLTGKDLTGAGINPIPTGWLLPDLKISAHHAIQPEEVNHVGDIVAAVIAESKALAEDAAALVNVDYEALEAVTLGSAALEAGAVQVHPEAPGNLAFDWEIGDKDATEAQFSSAHKTVRRDRTPRQPGGIQTRR